MPKQTIFSSLFIMPSRETCRFRGYKQPSEPFLYRKVAKNLPRNLVLMFPI
uniref:Uncharacterized protein n=1 Tax=Arundo donax TaxID=35708 RepID=A0A0A9H8E3_ARUDO